MYEAVASRASVRAVKVVTHNLTDRTEHIGGDVRGDTLIDDDSEDVLPFVKRQDSLLLLP